MEFEKFKAGHWVTRYQYKSFEPVLVNHGWTWRDPVIHQLLESANHAFFWVTDDEVLELTRSLSSRNLFFSN